jgi:hypothetical protein
MSKIDEPNKEFNFIKSLSDFYKGIVLKFKDNDESKINDDIIELGRTKEEKEQLQDMCDEIDAYHRRLMHLRESGMTPGKWLEKEIELELEKVDPEVSTESKEEFKKFIFDQFGKDVEAQAEALDEELNQTVDIAKGGKI